VDDEMLYARKLPKNREHFAGGISQKHSFKACWEKPEPGKLAATNTSPWIGRCWKIDIATGIRPVDGGAEDETDDESEPNRISSQFVSTLRKNIYSFLSQFL
jgi:hypothetical protein